MKKIAIIFFIFVSICSRAATYYVSTTGNDSNTGTISSPFATWQKLASVMVAGDQAYIRGGTYRSTMGASATVVCRWRDLHGTVSDTIKIYNYPGESPILNLDNIVMTSSYCYILFIQNCSYLHVKGLRITGLAQQSHQPSIFGMAINGSPHVFIENCEVDHLGMYGYVWGSGSDYNYVKNCDAHHLADNYSGYGGANGFGRTGGSTANYLTFDGCRAWLCSDDGWDLYSSIGYVTIRNCWAFWNGYEDETLTTELYGAQGFKLGHGTSDTPNATRLVTNCLSVQNTSNGIDQNFIDSEGSFASHIYNNTTYQNGEWGYRFTYSSGGQADIFRNNISYNDTDGTFDGDAGDTHDHNTWNGGVTVSGADFESLNTSLLDDPRQVDGSLPDITLLYLAEGSDLIDAGIDVGIGYEGTAPDMGAREFDPSKGESNIPTVITYTVTTGINEATGSGNVTAQGSTAVYARGVCWSTASNPTLSNSFTTDGLGTGEFTSSITSLLAATTYHVRAYASNSIGTAYGNEVIFTTSTEIPYEGGLIKHNSRLVKIGTELIKK